MYLWTAFLIGLLGSTHCIGMCGPIALALPLSSKDKLKVAFDGLIYNLGRISTYSIIGLLLGILGKGFAIAGMQKTLSLGMGIFLLIVLLFSINVESKIVQFAPLTRFIYFVKLKLGKLLKTQTKSALYFIGILNGFLPCGLVYMALAGAITAPTVFDSVVFMAAFGMGTLPLMLTVSIAGGFVTPRFRNYVRKITPVFIFLFAVLFMYRGLGIDLPMNLQFWIDQGSPTLCH